MNSRIKLLALSLTLATTHAMAQTSMDQPRMNGMDMSQPDAMKKAQKSDAVNPVQQADTTAMTEGEVRKIDKEQGKITLKHGAIKNLGMPGMTMIFRVRDKTMLDQVKEGDKVKFVADNLDNQLTVTKIESAS